MISPILLFVTTFTFINALQVFEPMYIMTNGGPSDRTRSIVMLVYETAFRRFEMGYAAAMATVILAFIMFGTLGILASARRWVHYQ
jgi:multiple sugar transport system permease protein